MDFSFRGPVTTISVASGPSDLRVRAHSVFIRIVLPGPKQKKGKSVDSFTTLIYGDQYTFKKGKMKLIRAG